MKKIFSFFFKSQTNDADRLFLTRITMSALAMVLCCGLFCASTLCYYNATTSVSVQKIQSGRWQDTDNTNESLNSEAIAVSGDDTDVDTGDETDTDTDTEPGTETEASSNS